MKTIASLEIDVADELVERLKKEAIPLEIQTSTQESGLDYTDIMVEDGVFDRACDVAEAWEADRIAKSERRSNRRCPSCGSSHLDYMDADRLGGVVWKCRDCGNTFAK